MSVYAKKIADELTQKEGSLKRLVGDEDFP